MALEFLFPFEGNISAVRAERSRIIGGFPNIHYCVFFPTEVEEDTMKGYFEILIKWGILSAELWR